MFTIGITGGVGSGKSLVCHYLEEKYNAFLCLADDIGHEVYEPGGRCYEELFDLLGEESFLEDGTLNRKKVGDLAFQDPSVLEKMNAIIHPAVKDEIFERITAFEKNGGSLAVIEAALLFEGKLDALCDETWYIFADRDVRIERLLASRPLTQEKAENIMARQKPDSFFFENCTRVIENSGNFENTKKSIDGLVGADRRVRPDLQKI